MREFSAFSMGSFLIMAFNSCFFYFVREIECGELLLRYSLGVKP